MFDLFGRVDRSANTIHCDCNDPELPRDDDYSVADTQVSSDNSGSGASATRSGSGTRTAVTAERSRNRGGANERNPNDGSGQRSGQAESPGEDSTKVMMTPYSKATPLFRAIEKQDWQGVLLFLSTSKWSNSYFVSTTEHLSSPPPKIQCQTWVTEYEKNNPNGRQEWSQLPLHAAISYGAPAVVIQKLIDVYPKALQKTDNEGMLPIHLAFGFSAPEQVLASLLKGYPQGARQRGPGSRLPHECCELGPNKVRGEVFGLVAEQVAALATDDTDELYATCVRENYQRLGLPDVASVEKMELTALLTVLLEERKELMELKLKQKSTAGTSPKADPISSPAVFGNNRSTSMPLKGRRSISPLRISKKEPEVTSPPISPPVSPSSTASPNAKSAIPETSSSVPQANVSSAMLDVESKLIRPPAQRSTAPASPTAATPKEMTLKFIAADSSSVMIVPPPAKTSTAVSIPTKTSTAVSIPETKAPTTVTIPIHGLEQSKEMPPPPVNSATSPSNSKAKTPPSSPRRKGGWRKKFIRV
jgi:hypothetical protein